MREVKVMLAERRDVYFHDDEDDIKAALESSDPEKRKAAWDTEAPRLLWIGRTIIKWDVVPEGCLIYYVEDE